MLGKGSGDAMGMGMSGQHTDRIAHGDAMWEPDVEIK